MLTTEQREEAVGQMIAHCRQLMEAYKLGVGDYVSLSARECLHTLGYDYEQIGEVLRFIADGGFDYCLDHNIPMTGAHEAKGKYPPATVCYWGVDQLESRLTCIRNLPYQYRARA